MASFDFVNYSLRPSKSIQRQIIFEGVKRLQFHLELEQLVYVGFGSIWFTDFIMAHKLLGINDMISIESDEIGYCRAVFNSPFATVRGHHGLSSEILPTLYSDESFANRPWMIWLDYDCNFDESLKDDIRSVVENAPINSILLVTFNGHETNYGKAADRPERLRKLFGSLVPDDLPKKACKNERMQQTLAEFTIDLMKSIASDLARPGGFVEAFRIIYKDSSPMITVGGILPKKEASQSVLEQVNRNGWLCCPAKPINAPHLTIREAVTLQSQLPSNTQLTRNIVQSLGFDLDEEQIEAFENYYRYYPAFAQIIT